jgi:tetratricopeptide (TPR) repeat protein
MNRSLIRVFRMAAIVCALLSTPITILGQTAATDKLSSVEGNICDPQDHSLTGVAITLESGSTWRSAVTDVSGHFRFATVPAGTYTLRAKLPDFKEAIEGPFTLGDTESKAVVLHLTKLRASDASPEIPFSEETHFTVAGVTDTTSLGGHGSDRVRRNSDALSKEAAQLANSETSAASAASIRERLAKEDTADLRFQLAEIEEKEGHSLDAAKDYQRAAEMAPTEPHLFALGAELLLHRAFEPSLEVFTNGRRRHPQSVRMILGLGSAAYALGTTDAAKQIFLQACDVNPADATPYLFLGKIQSTETSVTDGWADRLRRFSELHPENAEAHYLYAVALTKQGGERKQVALAESQLNAAIALNPILGDAYLELGILASQQGDLPKAVAFLKKAVEHTPLPDDAHYRLAQVYRRLGEMDKARQESELYKQMDERKNKQVERERHELQQFVYTLRDEDATLPNPPPQE